MNNSKLTLVTVCAAGMVAGYALNALMTGSSSAVPATRNLQITATISEGEVQALREAGFEDIQSIREVLRLPSMFARSEATFVLAGKSNGSTVQQLIFEAHEIADPIERETILGILFARLTEIDAQAALATARIEPFSVNQSAETSVWRAWARTDLDSAIDAVASESLNGTRVRIAQTLFRSLGYTGTSETDRVELRLGIAPDRNTISQYIRHLADLSPMLAVDYINSQVSPVWQAQYAAALGSHLALSGFYEARQFKDGFKNAQTRVVYEQSLMTAEATVDPIATIENLLAGGVSQMNQQQAFGALASIVDSDLDLARSYFDRVESNMIRQYLGSMIARQYAADDVEAALLWARENDSRENPELETTVLQVIAQSDPDRALEEIRDRLNSSLRFSPVAGVLMTVAQTDAEKAFGFLSEMEDSPTQTQLKSMLFSQWISAEPNEALNWALGQDSNEAKIYLSNPDYLVHQDVDRAIQMLPRLPDSVSATWRQQIAASLVRTRSLDDAMAFARGFSDQPGYESMLSGIAQSSASENPEAAMQVAAEISDSLLRDQAHAGIVQGVANHDPQRAMSFLDRIDDDDVRIQTMSMTTANWYRTDPRQAVQWMSSYPEGDERDRVMSMIAGQWVNPSPQEQRLLDSVSDPAVRVNIERSRIITAARTDPAKARRMLDNSRFSDSKNARSDSR